MAQKLGSIKDIFAQEADQIESCFHQCIVLRPIAAYKVSYIPAVEGCLTALWDAWGRFNRTVLLASADGVVVGTSGASYAPAVRRTEAVAIQKLKDDSRRQSNRIRLSGGEPVWSGPEMLSDICASLDLPAVHPLLGAITAHNITLPYGGATANPIDEIRCVRNFCAHKSDSTYLRMSAYFGGGTVDAHTHMKQKGPGGIARFSHWIDCLKIIADAATT